MFVFYCTFVLTMYFYISSNIRVLANWCLFLLIYRLFLSLFYICIANLCRNWKLRAIHFYVFLLRAVLFFFLSTRYVMLVFVDKMVLLYLFLIFHTLLHCWLPLFVRSIDSCFLVFVVRVSLIVLLYYIRITLFAIITWIKKTIYLSLWLLLLLVFHVLMMISLRLLKIDSFSNYRRLLAKQDWISTTTQ